MGKVPHTGKVPDGYYRSSAGNLLPKRPPRTIKEKKLVAEYLRTGNQRLAALRTYDIKSESSAGALAAETLAKLNIVDVLEKYGVTDAKLAQVHAEGLEADKHVVVGGRLRTVKDSAVRHKYLETAYKVKGHVSERPEVNIDNRSMVVALPDMHEPEPDDV